MASSIIIYLIKKKMINKIFNGSNFRANLDFKVKYICVKDFLKLNKLQKVYSIWKKTFKTIHQLSCFYGTPCRCGFLFFSNISCFQIFYCKCTLLSCFRNIVIENYQIFHSGKYLLHLVLLVQT